MLELGLEGKVAIVTGGSEGMGLATARRLAGEGARVAICARRAEPLEQAAAELRAVGAGEVFAQAADVTSNGDVDRFIDAVTAEFGGVDILVNNAGASAAQGLEALDDDAWMADIQLKVMGAVRFCRGVVPSIRERSGGAIVNATIGGGKAAPARALPTSVTRGRRHQPDEVTRQRAGRRQHSRQHDLHRPDQERAVGAPGRAPGR